MGRFMRVYNLSVVNYTLTTRVRVCADVRTVVAMTLQKFMNLYDEIEKIKIVPLHIHDT